MTRTKTEKEGAFEYVSEGLFRYTNGKYYARFQVNRKDIRKSLRTTDPALARRRLRDLRSDLERTGGNAEQLTLRQLCDRYVLTQTHKADKTVKGKRRAAKAIVDDFPGGADVSISKIVPSQVETWLARLTPGAATYNHYLEFIRGAFALAVRDRLLANSPVAEIKTRKRKKPIRDCPTPSEFRAIVASIRSQESSSHARDTGDFVEFIGLAGLGQAELNEMEWSHIRWQDEQINAFRGKTKIGFVLPLYPAVRPLLERMRAERGGNPPPAEKIFKIKDAKEAIKQACKRLGFRHYSHRAFRRMVITHLLQIGTDVKLVSAWQGHRDGGKLVLGTYSHVTTKHSADMAKRFVGYAEE